MNQKSKAALNRYLTRVDKGEPQEEEIEPRYTPRVVLLLLLRCAVARLSRRC
jgi:hypothetical protein